MPKKNDEFIVTIERLGANGEGIATIDGKVVFVPFALPDEKVKICIIKDQKSFFIAKVLERFSSNPNRIEPPCPYFNKCGGCDIQHLEYSHQLSFKTKLVEDNISKYSCLNLDAQPTVPSDKQFRYRNKFAFPVQEQDGVLKIGMFRKNSHSIIEIDDCLLQSERTKLILKLFREYMVENNISAFNEKTNSGIVKHIVVRENDESFLMTVVVTDEKFNKFLPLIEKFNLHFKNYGILKNVNKLNNNVIFGNLDNFVFGLRELEFNEFNINYFVDNRSFLQINNFIKSKIYEKIIDELSNEELIIDAYSGAGLLSSILAKHAKKVIGVEIVSQATQNANKLKELNALENLTNINGDCAKVIPELADGLNGNFSIVIDPPRKGIDKVVAEAIAASKPNKIVYLSCNPATLARDLNFFASDYDVKYVQPYDMFPQTANVETLVVLNKKLS